MILDDLLPVLVQRSLDRPEIEGVVAALFDPAGAGTAKANFLTAWAQRGETADELAACAEALLPRAVDPGLRGAWNGKPLLDCCGTGGGGLNLVNLSTALMFVLAAMGVPVVKHGNRGITKKSGSADVLEVLGIKIDLTPEQTRACLEKVGAAFLFAPHYHPSFAEIAPVRRELATQGQRTIFNLLGPLLNPARPEARLVGVFTLEHVALYDAALQRLGCTRYAVVCGEDAGTKKTIGEASANGVTTLAGTLPLTEHVAEKEPETAWEDLVVTNATESARRISDFLLGEFSLVRQTVILNAALAAWTHGTVASLEEGTERANRVLDYGNALARLRAWQDFSRELS